jgi:hypothetical protein
MFNLFILEETAQAVQVDTVLLASLVSVLLPLLVNLVTKQTSSDGLRAAVNMVGVALVAVAALWINPSDVPVTWQLVVNTVLASFFASFAAYKGIWKPTGVSGSVTAHTANFGLGSPPVVETPNKGAEDLGQVDNDPRA